MKSHNIHGSKVCQLGSWGFTILEVIIAMSITVIFFTGVYKIFRSVVHTQEIGAWVQGTTMEIRNGLNLLRNELNRAAVPKIITQAGTEKVVGADDNSKLYCYTSPFSETDFSNPKFLLQFYMCQPGRKSLPGEVDTTFEIMEGILEISDKMIVYRRRIVAITGVASPTPEINKIVCKNPSKIETSIEAEQPAELSVRKRNVIKITITAKHPKYPQTLVTETISAPFEVEIVKGTPPTWQSN